MRGIKNKLTIKNVCLVIAIFILLAKFFTTFNIYINIDEPFTMAMITHSFSNIFKIDLLDVHPPLYYFLLKIFLAIFTFWTNSITIKILFAKIFSLICYLITFYFLIKITKLLNINVNSKLILILYLLVPNIITYSLQIRMYELTAAFLTFELYELIKFDKTDNSNHLYLSILGALLASYSHYFGAISAGSFLLIYFVVYVLAKDKKKAVKTFISGIIFVLLFLPCITFAYKQFSYVMSNSYSNLMSSNLENNFIVQVVTTLTGFMDIGGYLALLFGLIILLINMYMIYYSLHNFSLQFNKILIIVVINLGIGVVIPAVISIISKPLFQARYLYPIASIYMFLLAIVTVKILQSHNNLRKILMVVLLLSLLLINIKNTKGNIPSNVRAHQTLNIAKMWNSGKEPIRHINCYNYSGNKTDLLIKEAVYSKYMTNHPKLYVKHLKVSQVLGSNNRKLLHQNFNNIYLVDKSE